MVKVALFDIDGVVIKAREKFFSQRLMDEQNIPYEQAMRFVHEVIDPSMKGEVDVKNVLPQFLKEWDIDFTTDQLLSYWWSHENTINQEVLTLIDTLRESEIKIYLASDQEQYRAQYLMKTLALQDHVDGAFFSYALGHTKNESAFWKSVVEKLGVVHDEAVYWDDDRKNVDEAAQHSIISHIYVSPALLKQEIQELLPG